MITANRLWMLDAPKIQTPESLVLAGGGDDAVVMPCSAFLIEHERGLVLVDGMLDPAAQADPAARYGDLAGLICEYTPEQTVPANLERLGFALTDVTHVVASHLHFDHAGALGLFPHAKFYIGRGELSHAARPAIADPFYNAQDVGAIGDRPTFEVAADHDLFGDGAITLLWLPGHVPGQLGLLVRLSSQNVLLACDVVHHMGGFEIEKPMLADTDTVTTVDSIRRCKLLADGADARIIISHTIDPTVPVAPEFLS